MRLWIAMTLMAVGLAAGTWWLTQTPSSEPEPTPVAAPRPEEGRTSPSSMVRTPPREHHILQAAAIEPIAVVPEIDELPLVPFVAPNQTSTIRVGLDRLAPRPETGIEPLPWMPYAEEATERVVRQTAEPPLFRPARELQETAEPPLGIEEQSTRIEQWRMHGKPPCSVK